MNTLDEQTNYTVRVPKDKTGARLDRLLADALADVGADISRTRIKRLVEQGRVWRGGAVADDVSYHVRAGEVYEVRVPKPEPAIPVAQDIPLNVVYEDADLIVIDKPTGLVVHPAAGHADGTLVNALLAHCGDSLSGIGGVTRPGIVHRLDKDTSGLMVVAKNDAAHHHLTRLFHDHDLERAYYALVWGIPKSPAGEIEGNIGRSPANRKKMAVLRRGGKTALTRYKVIRALGGIASLVRCQLATGRTHQIRVHMTHLGHPVIGDPLYGGAQKGRLQGASEELLDSLSQLKSQALHAYLIGFEHPNSGKYLRFESEKPNKFKELEQLLDRD
ncbi:MAG: RluA family pseudouridine synthase [Rhodospirillales bacterium]|jgi:23S rRNA pseudouridine1911/1915/1917 synthase|nr:RluA family pseudouridine synthase [Rhodospirillales bacterium]